jgi:hypothetical protein
MVRHLAQVADSVNVVKTEKPVGNHAMILFKSCYLSDGHEKEVATCGLSARTCVLAVFNILTTVVVSQASGATTKQCFRQLSVQER